MEPCEVYVAGHGGERRWPRRRPGRADGPGRAGRGGPSRRDRGRDAARVHRWAGARDGLGLRGVQVARPGRRCLRRAVGERTATRAWRRVDRSRRRGADAAPLRRRSRTAVPAPDVARPGTRGVGRCRADRWDRATGTEGASGSQMMVSSSTSSKAANDSSRHSRSAAGSVTAVGSRFRPMLRSPQ